MKRIILNRLVFTGTLVLLAFCCVSGVAQATPAPNGATIEARTFNDCGLSTLTTTNNYPTSINITDVMDPGCVGFANLHSWSFSADAGVTAAVFNNPSNYRFGADLVIAGAGEGEGGLRISPWYGKFVDGRFMANVTSGEIACFGGALPFYSFTVNHGITYVRGTTIRFEVTYLARDLFSTDPASIQYTVHYNGNTYDSGVLPFGQQNPAECNPNGLWGMLNDGRAGGYFQPRANTGASLSATWSNITFEELAPVGTPVPDAASIEQRTFNDCGLSTLTVTNNYPALISISDAMDPGCVGFANLHSWSFSDDGGTTAAAYHDNSNFHYFADFKIEGAGEGEGGLRISPWYGKFVDGRFMANATSGEIACFGGALPFYSFTGNHGITYTRGTTIHLDVKYRSNDLVAADPATIQYLVTYNGNTYDSGILPFGEANTAECDPYYLWGMLNDGRVGGYFQPRANTGAELTASWGNIGYSTCTDPLAATVKIHPKKINLKSKAKWITVEITVEPPSLASDIDVSSLTLNGVHVSTEHEPKIGDHGQKLTVRFPRPDVQATLTPGEDVPVVLTGVSGAGCIENVLLVDVKGPKMQAPAANATLAGGSVTQVQWDPADLGVNSVTLLSSFDDGVNWTVEAEGIPNTGSYSWQVPDVTTIEARLAVVSLWIQDETGPVNDLEFAQTDRFAINAPLSVGPSNLSLALHGAVPNPSRYGLNVSFTLPTNTPATLEVFDVTGRQVAVRQVGTMGVGRHTVSLAAAGRLPVGVYMLRLTQGAQKLESRAIVMQ